MEQIIVKHPDASTTLLVSKGRTSSATKAEQTEALLGADTVTITVKTATPITFYMGDQIEVYGKAYTLNQQPTIKKTGTRKFEYNLTFEGVQYELIDAQWLLPDNTVLDSFTGDLAAFLELLADNANRVFPGKWQVGIYPSDTEFKTLTYTGCNCLEVLQNLCEEYNTEFEIAQANGTRTINIKTAGVNFPYTFRYGRTGGLYELTRQNINSKNVVTRLYVYGGSNNLGDKYRYTKLCLSGKGKNASYIENAAAIAAFGLKENTKTFDKVYPNRYGVVSSLGSKYYAFVDNTMNFDLNEKESDGTTTKWLINDVTAKIKMTSGNLAGYEFEIHKYTHSTKEIQVVPFTDENGMKFPSETSAAFQFGVGDKYIFTDINLPDAYKIEAEAKLQEEGETYYNQYCQPQVQYNLSIDQNFIKQFAGQLTVENLFAVGDYIQVEDSDLGLAKSVRITGFTRDLLQPYKYSITLGDSVTKTTITRVIEDLQKIDTVIQINDLADPSKARRNWRAAQEVLANVFDPDGNYYSEKIKPLSIETTMLAVGAKSQQFTLQNTRFEPNYNGNHSVIKVIGGSLTHYTIEDTIKNWELADNTTTGLITNTAYYIYARCNRSNTSGNILFDTVQRTVDSDPLYYYFLIGTLSSVITDDGGKNPARLISLTYGASTINGRFIRTGRIQSSGGGTTYFDLDAGEIGGNIKFVASDGSNKELSELDDIAQETKNYINNTLPGLLNNIQSQVDGVVYTWFGNVDPTLTNAPANDWLANRTVNDHIGDIYYNTTTGYGYRFAKINNMYSWIQISDTAVTAALQAASHAQDTADGKRRTFTAQPYPPYDVGDIWVQGADGDIMRCIFSRATGNYYSSDWDKASKYTSDAALTTFINGNFATTVNNLTTQIDGKIESWFQTSDPSTAWTNAALKAAHTGDMWYSSSTKLLKRYTGSAWTTIEDQKAIDAYTAASKAQDTADGKRRVFVAQPYPPYDIGDLWLKDWTDNGVNKQELYRSITARATGSYIANDWVVAVYYDNTKTTIDGGIVTSGTVRLAGNDKSIKAGITGEGTSDTSVRIWAGASEDNKTSAPFRVLQDGTVYAQKAKIIGEVNATSGTFKNVIIKGSNRSPFTYASDSFDLEYSDNVVMISNGGGWTDAFSLPWTTEQSGRHLTLVNWKWENRISYGAGAISAPTGQYFYEDGIQKTELRFSQQCIELLGYGDSGVFYGWIVLRRINIATQYHYGRQLNVLAQGYVTGSNTSASINYITADGTTMTVQRLSEGKYKINFSSSWFSSSNNCIAMVTGLGTIYNGSNPLKANVESRYLSYIVVSTSDDSTRNDGSFMFQITNLADWT